MRTDRTGQGLRGPVESVRVETAEFKEESSGLIERPWLSHTTTFDRDGRVVESAHRNPDGSVWRTVNDYSDAGKLLATRHYDPAGTPGGGVRYLSDEAGRLAAEQVLAPDETIRTPVTYAYDSENLKTRIETLEGVTENVLIGIEGTNTSIAAREVARIETRYDVHDEVKEVRIYNAPGALVCRVELTRDADGRLLEETQFTGEVSPFGQCDTESCAVESEGPVTVEQQAEMEAEIARLFAPGMPMSRTVHRYDGQGKLIETSAEMMGMFADRRAFAYDEHGDTSEELTFDESGKLAHKALFSRVYDARGNWTEELVSTASAWDAEFGLSTPSNVTRRTITYYED